jgi:N-methylhydantoinase B
MYRTTRSPLFNQGDFAVGFLDARGRMIEQKEHLPLMAFCLFPGCQYLIDFFSDDIHEGDVFIHNDVWCNNLQHADTGFYKPIFWDGELIAWSACRGHWADIGGAVKGACNPEAMEVYQEALRIPPVKVWDKGVLRRDVWELIFANVRLRDMVEADAQAQIGACIVGERRLRELVEREGVENFRTQVKQLFDATERMVRAEIAAMPDGKYRGETLVYHEDPGSLSTSRVCVEVTIDGEQITFDYTGTDPQTPGFINASYTSAASATLVTLLYLLDLNVPHNEGLLRPLRINIPPGTILNAQFPAATFMGNKLCEHNSEAIMLALANAVPDRVTAPWARRLSYRITGRDPRNGKPFHDILFLTFEGGGAACGADGYNQPGLMGGGNLLTQDYEVFEIQNPIHLIEHEYVTDSGGAGEWRGGLGTKTVLRYYGDESIAVLHGDGTVAPPVGVFGGSPGTLNRVDIRYPDGSTCIPHAQEIVRDLPSGTISTHLGAGGGGYGSPLERDLALVVADVESGFVSAVAAETVYGVTILEDGTGIRRGTI